MWYTRTSRGLLVRAPAKVNLFLEVLGKRPDGYHDLATLLVAVSLFDTLEFKEDRSAGTVLDVLPDPTAPVGEERPALDAGPDNLVHRAVDLLRRRFGRDDGLRVRLHKRIPLAAGLAGGSTDAAATLAGLNLLWRLGLGREDLQRLGAELGSDVPFFFSAPAAWCTGRGEVVTPLRPGRALWLVLACPGVGLSTAAVFGALNVPESPVPGDTVRRAFEAGDVEALGRSLHNRLEPAAERLCPQVADLHRLLAQAGPAGHRMSGSGSTLFALCRDHDEAVRVAAHLRSHGAAGRVYIVRSCV
jgi:4-diphosphocytidyl-2-C-methyl-D-erythritol kinase